MASWHVSVKAEPLEGTGQVVPVHLGEVFPPDLSQTGILLTIPRTKDADVLTITALHLMQGGLEPWMHGYMYVCMSGGCKSGSYISSTCIDLRSI